MTARKAASRRRAHAGAAKPSAPAPRIEDYALIGNTRTAALVSRHGSIDWWCSPRFDSPACFAALLGGPQNGRWLIAPRGTVTRVARRYRPNALVLETEMHTREGAVRLIDCMALRNGRTDIVRILEGVRGSVAMSVELVIRFGYGAVVPWVRRAGHTLIATGGPDTLELRTPVELHGEDYTTRSHFTVHAGQRIPFVLTHSASHEPRPTPLDGEAALEATELWWQCWCTQCGYQGNYADDVMGSLMVLKALTYAPTGGMVAAPTTSLPECLGSVRNWDYRFCWLRDATFTLYALLLAGYRDEARAWREWLLRAAAGRPQDLRVLYGVTGERIFGEATLPWLPGFADSAPVRVGNAAATQFQLDIYGEVIDALCLGRSAGLAGHQDAWAFQRALLDYLESHWCDPDNGIWEMRGEPQHFTHSKVMCWVAMDRAIRAARQFGMEGRPEHWRSLRNAIHRDVCKNGFDPELGTFVQRYGSRELDASLLLLPIVGFLPPHDRRVIATVEAIERDLTVDGLVLRYHTDESPDGLPPGEGVFLPCSFWLCDALTLIGRRADAVQRYEHLLRLRNDVGLIAEEYDPRRHAMLGNFPQALTHVALVNSARNLSSAGGPSEHRSTGMRNKPPEATPRNKASELASRAHGPAPAHIQPAHLDSVGTDPGHHGKDRP
jgi:GH15 family glucan-1,4-alpha-glucosidase